MLPAEAIPDAKTFVNVDPPLDDLYNPDLVNASTVSPIPIGTTF
jgi:hypothetical protein